ncbi:MAG: alcohol dehydrogenase catalytic domain-containing protein [Polyangiaceae bacterium]
MNKIVVHRPGGFSRLKLESHPTPEPGPGEVRVSTRSIGVNYADCVVRLGLYKSARQFVGWPITPGFEFAGVVSALGPGVVNFRWVIRCSGFRCSAPTRANWLSRPPSSGAYPPRSS